jgi:uncharacterized membrane protein
VNLKNIIVMLALLLGGFVAGLAAGAHLALAGRIGLAAVFLFTAVGHFAKTEAMAEMLPPSVPARPACVLASGVFEAALAVALLVPSLARLAGIAAAAFLVAVAPINVAAAFRRIEFGGHATGPRYLWVRLPLQLLLIAWAYAFAIRSSPLISR